MTTPPGEAYYDDVVADPRPVFAVYRMRIAGAEAFNRRLSHAFESVVDLPGTRRSHLFNGRYENLYPPRECLPEIEHLVRTVERAARAILRTTMPLRSGFWFNRMAPGDVTSLHSHDDHDELLSAVYYVTAPADSGRLVFRQAGAELAIEPEAGVLLLFPPSLAHEVERHRGQGIRLSLAFNVGPLS